MYTLHATQRESNLATTKLQDIPTFDGQDSAKLEDWFMGTETIAHILTESHTHTPGWGQIMWPNLNTHLQGPQTAKCWNEIKGILRLKLCNANIHTYTSQFMEIQQKGNETLVAYIHHFKTATKWSAVDILSTINSAKYFSTLDPPVGYHYIPLMEDSIPKTAFTSPFGKYKYLKVPFGLAEAPAYFQELMDKVLKDLPFSIAYLDDIIFYRKTQEEHLDHLQPVFHKPHNTEL